ncbi:MAG: hypothetical protein HQL84_06615 [Magnetococcales bacterium]|nr:hypothetical protein [Magnetococcales bacterium]MBF0149705.1 hypothetical protein [Magnetococcales bacterium]MBF0174074.1 hypothetical protein [Magnetococcales bacterium]MBF0630754.1 hypothetical protein [Magnetococcales bacterium]
MPLPRIPEKLMRISSLWNPSTGVATFFIRQAMGIISIIIGLFLSIPGIPGPGFVLVFFGILLLDFPGKTRLINRFRHRRWFRLTRVFLRKRLRILLEMKILKTRHPE